MSTTYKIHHLADKVTPYAEEITGISSGEFRCNRSTTYHTFRIRHILESTWEYNRAVIQLFIDFKKSYDSVRRQVLYNIGIPMKLIRIIKMCLNESNSRVREGKYLFDICSIKNGLNKKLLYSDCFSTFL